MTGNISSEMNYKNNRDRFMKKLPENCVCVLFSGRPVNKSADLDHPFFANRNFFYLTGIEQESSILIIRKKSSLLMTLKLLTLSGNKSMERWTGLKLTSDEASRISGIYDIGYTEDFEYIFRKETEKSNGTICVDGDLGDPFSSWISDMLKKSDQESGIKDIHGIFCELRAIKSEYEICQIKKAIDITWKGICEILKNVKPGMKEYQAAALFEYVLADSGAGSPSFDSIVATGKNFNYLHYPQLNSEIKDGDMILLDLGARWNGLCSDISRAFPANGRFTSRQLKIYGAVRECQKTAFKVIKPGVRIKEINEACMEIAAEKLNELGILYDKSKIKEYYWHNVSHHLGLDVHDIISRDLPLERGMVITVEPGIYVPEWNTGLRIEDDVLVTETGCDVLSADIPREAAEIEEIMAQGKDHE